VSTPVDQDATKVPSNTTTAGEDTTTSQNVEGGTVDTTTVDITADCLRVLVAAHNEHGEMKKKTTSCSLMACSTATRRITT
jgi:hypothetical protein